MVNCTFCTMCAFKSVSKFKPLKPLHFVFLGWPITEEQIQEAATASGVLNVPNDFISPEFREECERFIPHPEKIESSECKDAFIFLKERVNV